MKDAPLNVLFASVCVALVSASSGCGGPAGPKLPDTVAVTGSVTLDGAPLQSALVNFVPAEGKAVSAVGMTDADGGFVLKIGSGPEMKEGAIPGAYKVWISSMVKPDGTRIAPDAEKPPAMQLGIESLPERYSRPDKTELTATVQSSGGEFKFELTSR